MGEIIRLDRNEVPYTPSEKVIKASRKGLLDLNRYPDMRDSDDLRKMLSASLHVEQNHVFLGSGSDSLIMQVFHLFSRRGKVVTVDPTFSFAAHITRSLETKLLKIRIGEPYSCLPINMLIADIRDACLMFVDNPNNPTGSLLLDRDSVNELCRNIDGVVLIDEAYYEFSHFTVVDMVEDQPNLAVVRTMSKALGLAGLRIGYMAAGDAVAKEFSNQALPYTLSKPSMYAAIEVLKDIDYRKRLVKCLIEERERVRNEMSKLGFKVYPSSTNFLMVCTFISSVTKELREYGILVADLSGQMGPGFMRVSIGTKRENDVLLESLKEIHSH